MIKKCVVLDGEIINVGDWDYQYDDEQNARNPLPDGATVEEKDMTYESDRGWFVTGTEKVDPDVELAEAISAAATLTELKAALLGNGKLARVKGRRNNK